jgi:hypothetical protein
LNCLYNESKAFVKVKNYKDANLQKDIKSDTLICLLTTNHRITIGEHIFWDWDDDDLVNFPDHKKTRLGLI